MAAGPRAVTFDAPSGWIAPPDVPVQIEVGESTRVSATFVEEGTGTLSVRLEPASLGARWRLAADGVWRSSGALASLPAGDYDVSFEAFAGWIAPPSQTLAVTEGRATVETLYYVDAATAEPLVHLELDESAGGLAVDASGNGRDGLHGGDMTAGVDGVFGLAASTGGEGGATGAFEDGLRVPGLAGGAYGRATAAFWYRLPPDAASGYLLTWGGSYRDPNQLSIYYVDGEYLRVRVRDGDDTTSKEEVAPPGFDDGGWHHVAVTKGPDGTRIYLDGRPVRASAMGAGPLAPPEGLRLGANENGQWGLTATFDDLRVWARELPSPEIEALFDAGNRGALRVDLLPASVGGRWRLADGPDVAWRPSGAELTDLGPGTYTVEFDTLPGWVTPSPRSVTVRAGDDLTRLGVYSEAGGPILEWRLDEAAGDVVLDTSGNGRDGAVGGDVVLGAPGLSGRGASTAGTGTSGGSTADAILTPDFAPDDSYLAASVALWYRLDVIHDGYLFAWGGSFNDPDHLSAYLDPQTGLRFRARDAADTSSVLQVSPPGFADGGWHHVVLVTDADGSRAYFDGDLVASGTMGRGVVTPRDVFAVGSNERGTFGIEATFDEVAVWDRALGDAEVAALFGAQASVPLTVDVAPAEAVAAGARWRLAVGDTGWRSPGETASVSPGPNTILFETLSAYRSPADVPIYLELGEPLAVRATYRGLDDGQLRVDLLPASASSSGAEWRLVDGPAGGVWRSDGEVLTAAAGDYLLELGPVPGFLTPEPRTVTVPADDLRIETVTYNAGGGPILHWPLDAADPGADIAGFGRRADVGERVAVGLGGVVGEAVQTAGPGGASGDARDALATGDFDTDDAYGEATVALWYRLPAQARDGYLFAWGGSNSKPDQMSAFLDVGTELRVRVRDSFDTTSLLSVVPPSFDDAAWHHLAIVKDGDGTRVYFDGAPVATHIMGSGTIRPVDGFYLGSSERREFGLESTFDEVRVWDRALSDLEVADLIAATPPPSGFGGAYRTADELETDLLRTAVDHPSIVEVIDYGDSYALSVGGHATPGGDFIAGDDLLAARVTNRSIAGDKPIFVLMACLHAREIATPELAMRLLDELTDLYGTDADITWLVDHHEVWIVPLANPDGHRYVALGAEPGYGARPWRWRKTVRAGGSCAWPPLDGSSTEGVDLNRNFPFQWGTASGQAGSSDSCSENYRGESAASEPETRAIMDLVRSLIPDQRGPAPEDPAPVTTPDLVIQLHSPFRTVTWPWGYTDSPPPNAAGLRAIGEKLATLSGYTAGQTHDVVYRMTGTVDDWVYGELGAAAVLMEVGEGLMPPYHRIDNVLWPEVRDAFVHAAKLSRAPYRLAHGPDVVAPSVQPNVGGVWVVATADDATSGGLAIAAAEAYVGLPPWDGSGLAVPLDAVDGAFDGVSEPIAGFVDTSDLAPGRHTLWIRAQDSAGHWGPPTAVFVDVP
ncbi:MAG: LamG-like jellyroll fold domain-containing protein [Acidobacteriota bacterium]